MVETDFRNNFKNNFKILLLLNHKKQSDIVNDLDINKSTLSAWLSGTRNPKLESIQLLADYFHVPFEYFFQDHSSEENHLEYIQKIKEKKNQEKTHENNNDTNDLILNIFKKMSLEEKKNFLIFSLEKFEKKRWKK